MHMHIQLLASLMILLVMFDRCVYSSMISSAFYISKMQWLLAVLLMFVVASPCLGARITPDAGLSFNVVNYGAKGNGQNDDSQAFLKAWQDVCGATQGTPTLLIPKKTFMLQPVLFQGPCKPASVNIMLQGIIIAPNSLNAWKWPNNDRSAWIQFMDISGLIIHGGGQFDGQGAAWWNCNSKGNCNRPTALYFHSCKNLVLSGLAHVNSPRNHIGMNACNGSRISNLHIIAPADSPNTDGIDVSASSNVVVKNSKIQTGDDCIAINGGSTFINVTGVFCGPGHGISIGSLGRNGDYDTVEEIHVRNCTFDGTTNGVRIKTWRGGSGYARKITFEDIIIQEANNPLIIDQQYVSLVESYNTKNAVKVSDVTYRHVTGTSSDVDAIQLNCDQTVGCTNIVLEGINITAPDGKKAFALCKNAQVTCSSCIPYVSCLSSL